MTAAPPVAWVDRADAGLAEAWEERRKARAWQDDPIGWASARGLQLRGAARKLFESRDSQVVIAGPAGTGKSLAALYRVHHAALNWPGARCLVLRKTARTLGSTTLHTFESAVATPELKDGSVTWFGGSLREPASYRYGNGSAVVVGGMDKPDKIMSSEYDLIFADEATELVFDDWQAADTRCRNGVLPWQQLLGGCNPSHPKHWLRERATDGPVVMLHSRHADNPAYTNPDGTRTPAGEAYLARLANLTGVRRHRLLDGVWAAAEGVVYETWDDDAHLIDPFEPPASWTRLWSVDFGHTNPLSVGFWAEDGDGRLYLYREIYVSKRLVEDVAKQVKSVVAPGGVWREPRPRAVVCDHDAEDRATLERHLGMSTKAAKKTVSDGIQAVQARLRPAGDGKPRLFVMRGALLERDEALAAAGKPLCLTDEVGGYVWEPAKDGKPAKEAPQKRDDHAMDMMRYAVAELDLAGRPRIRVLGG
jgi:phage terminase large subunit